LQDLVEKFVRNNSALKDDEKSQVLKAFRWSWLFEIGPRIKKSLTFYFLFVFITKICFEYNLVAVLQAVL